jgi:hypothetical protein
MVILCNGGTQGRYIACAILLYTIIGPAILFTTCSWESYFLLKLDSYIWFSNSIGCANWTKMLTFSFIMLLPVSYQVQLDLCETKKL